MRRDLFLVRNKIAGEGIRLTVTAVITTIFIWQDELVFFVVVSVDDFSLIIEL